MATLNYNHLRYFWAVAHDGNLTRTAEKLHVSQSALSLQIKKLEERLGQNLFERRGKQLVLTEAGSIALDHADVIFAAGEELLDTLFERDLTRQAALRVGALSTLSRNFQIEFLTPLLTAGKTRLNLRSGSSAELMALLQAQKLDVVLTDQPPATNADTPWLVHPISEQDVSLVGYPERVNAEHSLKDLVETQPIIVPSKDSSIRLGLDAFFDQNAMTPNIIAEVDDMALLRVLAREDIGLTVVPPIVVKDELASGLLTEIEVISGTTETFYAVTMPRRFPNPALRAVLSAPQLPR
ncbi:MAG: LysR family transcriptional regulator [Pseudomonadota bacterium]